MDSLARSTAFPRTQLLFGAYPQLRSRDRVQPDERIDVPAIQESARVSFGKGIGPQASLAVKSSTEQQVALYERVQAM